MFPLPEALVPLGLQVVCRGPKKQPLFICCIGVVHVCPGHTLLLIILFVSPCLSIPLSNLGAGVTNTRRLENGKDFVLSYFGFLLPISLFETRDVEEML